MSSEPSQHDQPLGVSDEDALDELVASSETVLVEFYTNGCGICQSMEPVLGVLAKSTDATVATINPRDDPGLVERFQVQSVPLLVLFADGEEVARRAEGFVGADDLRDWIDGHR